MTAEDYSEENESQNQEIVDNISREEGNGNDDDDDGGNDDGNEGANDDDAKKSEIKVTEEDLKREKAENVSLEGDGNSHVEKGESSKNHKKSKILDNPDDSSAKHKAQSMVPKSSWPVNFKTEDNPWVDIHHPANPSIIMKVPPFWSVPIHDNVLMSREKAMQIGSCIVSDDNGSFQLGMSQV